MLWLCRVKTSKIAVQKYTLKRTPTPTTQEGGGSRHWVDLDREATEECLAGKSLHSGENG